MTSLSLKLETSRQQERGLHGAALSSWGGNACLAVAGMVLLSLSVPCIVFGQDIGGQGKTGHSYGVEVKTHYRDSDLVRFPSPFPPTGPKFWMETVDAGESFEVSAATVFYRGNWGEEGLWSAKAKIDLFDKHDRNPTSTDREWDVDELWLRFGPELEAGEVHEGFSAFAKVGKFPKFERQDDRHLESYGLISTSFNRAEDVGLELGFDLGQVLYMRFSLTQGNPVFYRDPNALAGDHGTVGFPGDPATAELETGFPILYDADVDEVGFDNPELGLGLGARFGDGVQWNLDLLVFGYERDLADTVELHGTGYGGDLDLLKGPGNAFPLFPITSDKKEEFGFNAWLYVGDFTLFAQYVDQDLGGLKRDGYEVELSWDFELPWFASLFGRQVLPFIAPAIRYSEIDPQFGLDPQRPHFPAASTFWDWEKIDLGVRLGLVDGLADLTVEYADNTFVRGGNEESADEFLATLRFMWDSRMRSGS